MYRSLYSWCSCVCTGHCTAGIGGKGCTGPCTAGVGLCTGLCTAGVGMCTSHCIAGVGGCTCTGQSTVVVHKCMYVCWCTCRCTGHQFSYTYVMQ